MCDQKVMKALGNGQADDLKMQGLGIKNCMEMLDGIRKQLQEIPTRSEVREMIHESLNIHAETCRSARDDGGGAVLSLGKGGLSAQGRAGVKAALWIVGLIIGVILALGFAGPRLAELVAAWK